MKRFPKTVRQCLATALISSTILESAALPIQSAPSPAHPDRSTPADPQTQPTAAALLPVQPASMGNPRSETIEPAAAPEFTTAPSAQPLATFPVAIPTPPPAAPIPQGGGGVGMPQATTITPQPNVPQPNAPAVNTAPTALTSVETTRQALAAKLAEIVARDKPQRESQLRQNLVAAALHYAQVGQLDRARQTAQNPALPIDIQTETLGKIELIAAILPSEPSASPAAPVLQPLLPLPSRSTAPVPDRWVLPAPPSGSPFYLGNRCLPRSAPAPLPSIGSIRLPTVPTISPEAQPSVTRLVPARRSIDPVKTTASAKTAVAEKVSSYENREARKATPLQTNQAIDPASFPKANQEMSQEMRSPGGLISAPTQTAVGSPVEVARDEDFLDVAMPIAKTAIEAPAITALQPDAIVNLDFSLFSVPFVVRMPSLFASAANFSDSLFGLNIRQSPNPPLDIAPQPWRDRTVAVMATNPAPTAALMATATSDGCGFAPQLPIGAANSMLARSLNSLGMMFPLPIPAAITSLFGWRIHPITGTRRFHAGIDLGAPMGTPILAALPGRVVVADYEGGYGLTIVLENSTATERNLYGHLSAIGVRPGDVIAQGQIIGWVGSTGNSTGPHLHFETQLPIGGTWQAVNPIATTTASR